MLIPRSVFEAVRDAAAAGLVGLGIMDVFANTSGFAALAMRELGHLGVDVFGGIILEPYVGGIDPRVVRNALAMGYGPGTGARFVSLPCHHTRSVAEFERRSADYVASCFYLAPEKPIPDALKEIFDLIAAADAVFNSGHVSGTEALRLVEEARSRGVTKISLPRLIPFGAGNRSCCSRRCHGGVFILRAQPRNVGGPDHD